MSEVRKLARDVARLQEVVRGMATGPQAAYSSIEGGSIDSYDHDGNLRLRIGDQGDGTQTITVVDGPVPPAPSAPVVAVDGPVLTVSWDGQLADDDQALPADFARIHVHLSQTADMTSAPVRASIEAKAGASTVTAVDEAGTWWVALAVEAQSGKRSPLSTPVEAVVSLVDLDGALDAVRESADGKNRNYYNPVEPSPDEHELAEGDLWFDTSEDGQNLPHRWDGTRWVSVADQRVEAVRSAMESMRGDLEGQIEGAAGNKITWSPAAPPSGAAPGKPGDTWFQIQAGRVTGQWAHDGTTWVARPISHEVIASLDLGKATVGELDGARIKAGSVLADAVLVPGSAGSTVISDGAVTTEKIAAGAITAESGVIGSLDLGKATVGELDGARIKFGSASGEILKADALDGKVVTGTVVQTARSGARVVLGEDGLSVYDSADDWRVRLTPSGSMFKGDMEAESLVATGPAELRHAGNSLAPAAELALAAGVGDPTGPPTVQPFWPSIDFDLPWTPAGQIEFTGLAFDGTAFWTSVREWTGDGKSVNRHERLRIDPDTGDVTKAASGVRLLSEPFGVARVGDRLYWLGEGVRDYQIVVEVTDLVGRYVTMWEYLDAGWSASNPLGYKPGIGATFNSGLIIAHCTDNGSLRWRLYTTTGELQSMVDCKDGTRSDIAGVYYGGADWPGSTNISVLKGINRSFETFDQQGRWQPSLGWRTSEGQNESGLCFANGAFHSIVKAAQPGGRGKITRYAGAEMGGEDWWSAYRWAGDTNDDGTADHLSRISPARGFAWPARSQLKVLGAQLPDGVSSIAPVLAKSTTRPAREQFRTPAWTSTPGRPEAVYESLPKGWDQTAPPVDANSFPDASPAVVRSANRNIELRGDGSAKLGPLVVDAVGAATVQNVPLGDTGWIDLPNPNSAFSEKENGQYRIRNGIVFFRGRYQSTGTGAQALMTLPPSIRPGYFYQVSANSNTTTVMYWEISASGVLSLWTSAATGAWASLTSITYPI